MKKTIAFVLAAVLVFSVVGCAFANDDIWFFTRSSLDELEEAGETAYKNGLYADGVTIALFSFLLEERIINKVIVIPTENVDMNGYDIIISTSGENTDGFGIITECITYVVPDKIDYLKYRSAAQALKNVAEEDGLKTHIIY